MIFTWTITTVSIVWVLLTHRLSVCVCVLFVPLLWELGLYQAGKVDVYPVTWPGQTPFLLAYITQLPLNLVHVHVIVCTALEKLSDMTTDSGGTWSYVHVPSMTADSCGRTCMYIVHIHVPSIVGCGMIGIWKQSNLHTSSMPYVSYALCGYSRYGIEILSNVREYYRAIRGQCCACSMTRKSSLQGPVILPYGEPSSWHDSVVMLP